MSVENEPPGVTPLLSEISRLVEAHLAARGTARPSETALRAFWESDASTDSPMVRFANGLLLGLEHRGATHLRLSESRIEMRSDKRWHELPLLDPRVRSRAVEEASFRLKQMSGLDAGPPANRSAGFGTLSLVMSRRFGPERTMTLGVAFVQTVTTPVLVLGVLPAEGATAPIEDETGAGRADELAMLACERLDWGRLDEAESAVARAITCALALFGSGSALLRPWRELGRLHYERGRLDAALAESLRVHGLAERLGSDDFVCETALDLGLVYLASGKLDEAAARLRRAMEGARTWNDNPFEAEVGLALARVLLAQGQERQATSLLEHASEIAHRLLPPAHPHRIAIETELARHSDRATPYR